MAEPLRHRQTKGVATDMFCLKPPRHIPTLPVASLSPMQRFGRCRGKSGLGADTADRSLVTQSDTLATGTWALKLIHALPDDTDEPGAEFLVVPPDHFVFALLGYAMAGEEQHEFIGNVEPVNMEPHAAVGNVHDNALARQRAVAELDPGHTVERPARLPAPLVRQQRKHDPAPCCGEASSNWR